jgi:hypothetical protein
MSSFANEVEARVAEREEEILRQMTDVFKELARISVDLGAVWHAVEELRAHVDAQAATLAELLDVTSVQTEVGNQSTEILGRLLQSARARLDVLEGAAQHSA